MCGLSSERGPHICMLVLSLVFVDVEVDFMAFRLVTTMQGVEYRGSQSGYSERTKRNWLSLVFEDKEFNQFAASVPTEMQNDIRSLGLVKGDLCDVAITAVASADGNSYITLRALPELFDGDSEDDEVGY